MRGPLVSIGLLLSVAVAGQPWIGVTGAFESGWWVYNKGLDAQGKFLGADRTRHAPMLSAGVEAGWQFHRLRMGIEAKHIKFAVSRMEASDHAASNNHSYAVAEDNVTMSTYELVGAYRILESDWFSLWPRVTAGSFAIQTTHPKADQFAARICWSGGMEGAFKLGCHWSATASVHHAIMAIGMNPAEAGENHRIYRSGFQASVCYRFRKCEILHPTYRSY
jgi:hypothetical protein